MNANLPETIKEIHRFNGEDVLLILKLAYVLALLEEGLGNWNILGLELVGYQLENVLSNIKHFVLSYLLSLLLLFFLVLLVMLVAQLLLLKMLKGLLLFFELALFQHFFFLSLTFSLFYWLLFFEIFVVLLILVRCLLCVPWISCFRGLFEIISIAILVFIVLLHRLFFLLRHLCKWTFVVTYLFLVRALQLFINSSSFFLALSSNSKHRNQRMQIEIGQVIWLSNNKMVLYILPPVGLHETNIFLEVFFEFLLVDSLLVCEFPKAFDLRAKLFNKLLLINFNIFNFSNLLLDDDVLGIEESPDIFWVRLFDERLFFEASLDEDVHINVGKVFLLGFWRRLDFGDRGSLLVLLLERRLGEFVDWLQVGGRGFNERALVLRVARPFWVLECKLLLLHFLQFLLQIFDVALLALDVRGHLRVLRHQFFVLLVDSVALSRFMFQYFHLLLQQRYLFRLLLYYLLFALILSHHLHNSSGFLLKIIFLVLYLYSNVLLFN